MGDYVGDMTPHVKIRSSRTSEGVPAHGRNITLAWLFAPCAIGPLSVLFVTLVHCGQTVGWIKMLLGMEVGLGPGHIVLDRDPAPPPKGAQQSPLFGPCLLWPNDRPAQQLLSTCFYEIENYTT